jgi:hypothetical protein
MKRILLILVSAAMLMACTTFGTIPTQPCTIYADHEATPINSLIAEKIEDPCVAVRLITTAAKLPVIEWEQEYIRLFNMWAAKMEWVVQNNVSYAGLQDIILVEVRRLNIKAGMALLIVSDSIFMFDETEHLLDKDVELMLALIKHLRAEVNRMGVLL